ncbi:hypothetical protein Poly51_17930 [Rubripirellula tenax]|uniref:Uncharacterized protein n=1 Tax=Rubripirellula tenax TaxID=2528015 RepID=A0A5C6FC43_9BACT|nr:hypothetical protein [Rubripirellula tenax]TWU59008.1 hypothetical protein Poly51_17930 [Rubripirellula tenax]
MIESIGTPVRPWVSPRKASPTSAKEVKVPEENLPSGRPPEPVKAKNAAIELVSRAIQLQQQLSGIHIDYEA